MGKYKLIIGLLGFFLFVFGGIAFAQEDKKGCKDHPMFTRMPNFYIYDCKEKDFDQIEFVEGEGKYIKVEGKLHRAEYVIKKGIKAPTDLQILRNFQNAIKKIGGV